MTETLTATAVIACTECGRSTRPVGTTLAQYPDTITRVIRKVTLCATCATRIGRDRRKPQPTGPTPLTDEARKVIALVHQKVPAPEVGHVLEMLGLVSA